MASDRKTLANVAAELSRTQATQLDAGCAALLRAGVHPLDLEIVHETASRPEIDDMVIHQRAYVRAGRRRDLEAWDDGRRTGDAEGFARAIAERTGCRACGYLVILADTEDWPAPLCAGCHERHVAVAGSEYASAIADVCAWLRETQGASWWGHLADEIEARFGAKASDE